MEFYQLDFLKLSERCDPYYRTRETLVKIYAVHENPLHAFLLLALQLTIVH